MNYWNIVDSPPTHTLMHAPAIMVGFESSEYSVSEEDGSITISVQKTGSSDVNVTVVFTTTDGNATGKALYSTLHPVFHIYLRFTASDDYVSTEVEITFSPTDTEYTVTVPLRNDETLESTESFTAVLSVPSSQSGVELTSVSTTITITDNDSKYLWETLLSNVHI